MRKVNRHLLSRFLMLTMLCYLVRMYNTRTVSVLQCMVCGVSLFVASSVYVKMLGVLAPPLKCWWYGVQDRTNLAFAALQLNRDLGFSTQTYGLVRCGSKMQICCIMSVRHMATDMC